MMRVLHIAMGSPEFDAAAIDLGHDVRRIPWREMAGRRFTNTVPGLQSAIMRQVSEFKPNLVFVQTHQSEVIEPATYKAVRDAGAFVVNWCGDVRNPLPECYLRYAEHVDVMAFSNMADVDDLKARGYRSEYLQIGYDPNIYHPGAQDRSGIVFMANHYEGGFPNTGLRKKVAQRMMEEFPHDFKLYGSGWNMKGVMPIPAPLDADALRSALVAINVDHFTRPYFASDRMLRATACGCAVISMDYEGMNDEHLRVVAVNTIDEMVEAARLLLSKPEACLALGKMNAVNTRNNHRWHNRIKTIESWMC